MGKIISIVVSAIVGSALAAGASWGILTSATKAPNHNPANSQVVDYGNR
ncbi:MAG TPA: DUF2613 family protein [Jatrophihabitantaceae bacterium]